LAGRGAGRGAQLQPVSSPGRCAGVNVLALRAGTLLVIINGDGGCGFWQPTGGLTARVVWPGLRVGSHLAPCHIHHMNRMNSRSGSDDSTINIIVVIIILAVTAEKACFEKKLDIIYIMFVPPLHRGGHKYVRQLKIHTNS